MNRHALQVLQPASGFFLDKPYPYPVDDFYNENIIFVRKVVQMRSIDIHILPKKAREELVDFYNFLVKKYVAKSEKHIVSLDQESKEKEIKAFFDNYQIDLSGFSFNRDIF